MLNQAFRVRQILLQQTNCWHYHDYHDWQSLSQESSLYLPWTQKGRQLVIPWPNELKRNAEWRSLQGFKATFELLFSHFLQFLTVSMMPPFNFVRPPTFPLWKEWNFRIQVLSKSKSWVKCMILQRLTSWILNHSASAANSWPSKNIKYGPFLMFMIPFMISKEKNY